MIVGRRTQRRALRGVLALALPTIWVVCVAAAPVSAAPTTIYVALNGTAANAGHGCHTATFSTVSAAVAAAWRATRSSFARARTTRTWW